MKQQNRSEAELRRAALLKRNEDIIRLSRCLMPALALAIPTIVTFWQSHGMSLFEVLLLESIFAFVVVAGEVPSGYFADRFGRKQALLLGGVGICAGTTWYTVAAGFNEFLLAEVLIAFGISLTSGADEALLFDSLKEQGKEEQFTRIWGEINSVEIAVSAGSLLVGGFLAELTSPRHPFFLASVVYVVYCILISLLAEADHESKTDSRASVRDLLKSAIEIIVGNAPARRVILLSTALFSTTQSAFWLLQPYFAETGLALFWNGIILALLSLVASLSCRKIAAVEKQIGFEQLTVKVFALSVFSFGILGMAPAVWLIPIFAIHQIVRAYLRVTVSQKLNRLIHSRRRATGISVKNCIEKLTYAVLLIPCGAIAEESLSTAFLFCGFAAAAGGVVLYSNPRK